MGLLKNIVKFVFSPLSNSKDVFDSGEKMKSLVDKGVDMLDMAFYTPQEKAVQHSKFVEYWLKYLETTKGQNLARREIAVYTIRTYLFLVVFAIIVYPFNSEWSLFVFESTKNTLFWIVSTVIVFYFGAGIFRTSKNGNGKK